MKKSEFMQLGESFRKYFGKSLNLINFCEMYPTGELAFDILAFESFLIGHGYNDETDGSSNGRLRKSRLLETASSLTTFFTNHEKL